MSVDIKFSAHGQSFL